MDTRLRDAVSPFLGNFFPLVFAVPPVKLPLKIKVASQFFTSLAGQLSNDANGKEKQRLLWLLVPRDRGCIGAVQGSSHAEHGQQTSQAKGIASQLPSWARTHRPR